MTTYARLAIATVVVALALLAASSVATALRSLSIAGETTTSINGVLTFEGRGGIEAICPVTITSTISRIIAKITGLLVGRIFGALTGRPGEARCRSSVGTLRAITTLGLEREELWRIFYNSFAGTLPTITAALANIHGVQISITAEEIGITETCLYEGEVPVNVEVNRGVFGNFRFLRNELRRVRGSTTLCPAAGQFLGTLVPLQSTTLLLI